MKRERAIAMIGAAAVLAAGLLLSLLLGGTLVAALTAIVAGAGAVFLLTRSTSEPPTPAPALERAGEAGLDAASLLEGMDSPMMIVRGRRVLHANEAARRLLGGHIEGSDVRLALRHPAAAERLTRGGDTGRIELTGVGERERRWEMAVSRLADGSRLVALTDRSEVHASEKMRADFVANASHELRTPLAAITGFIETLEDERSGGDRDVRTRFLSIMAAEAARMQRLIDDLISLSRIEAERFTPARETVDLLALTDEVRAGCASMIERKKARVDIESGAFRPLVQGDRAQLLQLVQNLLVNALKYGRDGEAVLIRFEQALPDMLRMHVIDRGEGIAPEHLPRLTERFYRVDAGRSRAVGGTGLGLAIVKHIVSRHKGQLDIRSELGEGTTVTVSLPTAPEGAVTKA